jgi:hypothetical protein
MPEDLSVINLALRIIDSDPDKFWTVAEIKKELAFKHERPASTSHISTGLLMLVRSGVLIRRPNIGKRGGYGYQRWHNKPSDEAIEHDIIEYFCKNWTTAHWLYQISQVLGEKYFPQYSRCEVGCVTILERLVREHKLTRGGSNMLWALSPLQLAGFVHEGYEVGA